jgi:hypothetical protein
MEVISAAQQEMNSIIAERRITTALNKNVPSAVDYVFEIGSEVSVFVKRRTHGQAHLLLSRQTTR